MKHLLIASLALVASTPFTCAWADLPDVVPSPAPFTTCVGTEKLASACVDTSKLSVHVEETHPICLQGLVDYCPDDFSVPAPVVHADGFITVKCGRTDCGN